MPNAYASWRLNQWLHFLEHRHLDEVQLRLINIRQVAQRLDLLDIQVPVITVGGTNGKGSTIAALTAIYVAAGYQVGSYTSPHLLRFNERICVNGKPISDEALCNAFCVIEAMRETIALTYFEVATLAALLHFKQAKVDVLLLEVGIGGRLDATNIIDAEVAIITTVDLDHQDYLGHDKEAIGYEKAGIMRANKPCIYADESVPRSVIAHANAIHAKLSCLGADFSFNLVEVSRSRVLQIDAIGQPPIVVPAPQLNVKSAVAALLASAYLSDVLPVSPSHWALAMQRARIPGRQQLEQEDVAILYDVAHNPQSARLLADFIANGGPYSKIHAVFSGLQDKDIQGMISPLSRIVDHWYPTLLSGKRAASAHALHEAFQAELGRSPPCFQDPVTAFNEAKEVAVPGDLIVVYGSFVLVGAIMTEKTYETCHH